MSRLIVKNLPKNTTEEKIRSLFGQKGTVTDVQLKYTPDGKFRQFAFVGYQLENEAEEAIKQFNNMFINTSKIVVEHCALLGDSKKPKAWSKYAPDSSAFKSTHPTKTDKNDESKKEKKKVEKDETVELLSKYKDDPMFEEFLELHAPKEKEKLHKTVEDESTEAQNEEEEEQEESGSDDESESETTETQNKLADEKISDIEYMKKLIKKKEGKEAKVKKEPRNFDLFTLKLKGLPYNCKKKDIKHFLKPVTPFSIRIPTKIHGIAYIGFKTEKDYKKALLKDRSFISGKRIFVTPYNKKQPENLDGNDNFKASKWISQEEALKNEENVAESGKIFVRNLAYTTTEDDIENLFQKYGPLAEVNLPIDSVTKKIKGFGTVTFVMPEHAVKAYSELDGSVLHGRMLHLLPGKNKDTTTETETLEESSNYKKKKAAKQKAQAGSSHNWNSLFLGHNAVADVIADSFGTSKEKVLAINEQDSAAVRLALGETQIVAQTRKYLEQEGVVLDAFSDVTSKRSKRIIIVKNLPSKTEGKEIRNLFEKYGLIGRLIMPPSGITALVEFLEPSEARKAFTCLAYTKFKNVPLYLEWAPENSLKEKPVSVVQKDKETVSESQKIDESCNEEIVEEPEPDTTLFVKNLNFQTTDEDLKKHFESCGKIFYATVATKKDKNDPNKRLSMGYGFVRFVHKSGADKALKTLQQSVLGGKSLELKRSERTLNNEVTTARKVTKSGKQTGTKILVRNVPFQATSKEIRELFSTFGEIKALRLPRKMALNEEGSHRGFAFVDFITTSDAKQAFEALSQSTHLYGRRLVLEWAASEEGVEDLRKRTAAHFKSPEVVKSKKSVFNID